MAQAKFRAGHHHAMKMRSKGNDTSSHDYELPVCQRANQFKLSVWITKRPYFCKYFMAAVLTP